MSEADSKDPVGRYLEAIEGATIASCEALSANMVLDATVPNWHFTVSGETSVRGELGRWYAHQGRFEELRRTPLPNGELVEFTLSWAEGGVPHAVHQAHVVAVEDDRIIADRVWCGGRWPAALLAEMAAAERANA